VGEVEASEASMQDVWWGGLKIKVNVARFGKEEVAVSGKAGKEIPGKPRLDTGKSKVEEGVSFREMVMKNARPILELRKEAVKPVLDIVPSEEVLEDLKLCFMGTVHHYLKRKDLQTCLFMEGWRGIKVVSMGDKRFLLRGDTPVTIPSVLEEKKVWWATTFKNIRAWAPQLVADSRRAWIQVRGLPLHIWEEDCFKRICSLFGEFVDFDDSTADKTCLDQVNLLISTKRMGRIDEKVSVQVMGAVYGVWVVESGLPKVMAEVDVGLVSEEDEEGVKGWGEEEDLGGVNLSGDDVDDDDSDGSVGPMVGEDIIVPTSGDRRHLGMMEQVLLDKQTKSTLLEDLIYDDVCLERQVADLTSGKQLLGCGADGVDLEGPQQGTRGVIEEEEFPVLHEEYGLVVEKVNILIPDAAVVGLNRSLPAILACEEDKVQNGPSEALNQIGPSNFIGDLGSSVGEESEETIFDFSLQHGEVSKRKPIKKVIKKKLPFEHGTP